MKCQTDRPKILSSIRAGEEVQRLDKHFQKSVANGFIKSNKPTKLQTKFHYLEVFLIIFFFTKSTEK